MSISVYNKRESNYDYRRGGTVKRSSERAELGRGPTSEAPFTPKRPHGRVQHTRRPTPHVQSRPILHQPGDIEFGVLDVRQPKEYEASRIPGAKLVPLPELTGRLTELDPDKPVITY